MQLTEPELKSKIYAALRASYTQSEVEDCRLKDVATIAANAAITAVEQARREYIHHPLCNGDRHYPAGDPGHSCSCFNLHTNRAPQVGVPRDLVERCARAFDNYHYTHCDPTTEQCMTAALRVAREDASCQLPASPVVLMPDGERVALEDPRVLGEPTDDECGFFGPHWARKTVSDFITSRCARLS